MKITAPASSAREAATLISCGADELYCGIHPRSAKGSKEWVNRRGPGAANVSSMEELKKITGVAHDRGVSVYLALNLPFYPPEQFPGIISLACEAVGNCEIDALIIGDPGMMAAVKEALPGTSIHASSLAAIFNSSSVSFFRALGASRIIFPRYIGVEDLGKTISRAGPDVEYEVFILNDGCVFEEGYCHASHAFGGAFCHRPWLYSPVESGADPVYPERKTLQEHLSDYRKWLWHVKNCGGMPGPGHYPLGMCGLCAIPQLSSLGVASLKIVGRESVLSKKAASVRLVRRALDLAGSCDPQTFSTMVKSIKGVPHLCSSGYMCYFR